MSASFLAKYGLRTKCLVSESKGQIRHGSVKSVSIRIYSPPGTIGDAGPLANVTLDNETNFDSMRSDIVGVSVCLICNVDILRSRREPPAFGVGDGPC